MDGDLATAKGARRITQRKATQSSMAKKPTKVIYRSAVTGRVVTPQYAAAHPKTTEKEHRPVGKKKQSK
jgi:hypothetical protein